MKCGGNRSVNKHELRLFVFVKRDTVIPKRKRLLQYLSPVSKRPDIPEIRHLVSIVKSGDRNPQLSVNFASFLH